MPATCMTEWIQVTGNTPWRGTIGRRILSALAASQRAAFLCRFGSSVGFLFLAAIAAAAFSILGFLLPETREKRFLNSTL